MTLSWSNGNEDMWTTKLVIHLQPVPQSENVCVKSYFYVPYVNVTSSAWAQRLFYDALYFQ